MPPADRVIIRSDHAPLAKGELSPDDAAELAGLKEQIERHAGFRCTGYKERCLRRRIAVRMRARQVHGYAEYGALLGRDPEEYARLIDAVTINVSKFYRNPDTWALLDEIVLPRLLALDAPRIEVWSAGCAAGEEIYTLAILLRERAERDGVDITRFHLRGTDIDRRSLEDAKTAEYGAFALTELPEPVRRRWFEGPGFTRLRSEIRRMVEFEELDLITDPYPSEQHLILCRNVVIYFERRVQEAVFRRFHQALAPGGFLMLGKVETLFGETARAFRALAGRERLFQRP